MIYTIYWKYRIYIIYNSVDKEIIKKIDKETHKEMDKDTYR